MTKLPERCVSARRMWQMYCERLPLPSAATRRSTSANSSWGREIVTVRIVGRLARLRVMLLTKES